MRSAGPEKPWSRRSTVGGDGSIEHADVLDAYVDRLLEGFSGPALRIGWDAGNMFARQPLDQCLHHRPRRAIAGIPADAQRRTGKSLQQAIDIGVEHIGMVDATLTSDPVRRRRHRADRLNLLAIKWRARRHEFEAIVIGGIMAAGYLYPAIRF